jgi:ligand-binding sensor domain-containing protein
MFPRFQHWLTYCLLGIFINVIRPTLDAQPLRKPMRVITTKDGLPQSFVSGLVQDNDGFVWVGTRNGLARYDGSRFQVFHHHNQDTTTLTSNVLISLFKDTFNQIWIEHESGDIDVMDPETEIISRVTARPLFRSRPDRFVRRGWLPDPEGKLWSIKQGKGLLLYDWKKQKVTHYSRLNDGFPSDTIRGLLEDRKRQIWVVSQRGISRFDPGTGRFSHIPIPFLLDFNNYLDSDAEVIAVHERTNGEIMLADRKQLIFFNPDRHTFRTVPLPFYPSIGIRRIQTGPDGDEYMESEGRVYRYSDAAGLRPVGEIELIRFRDSHSFLVDRSGLIWLGLNAAGIHQLDLTAPSFESHPNTSAFHQDILRQKLGVALDQFADWPLSDTQFKFSSYFFRSTYDATHQLWIALRDRVIHYDSKQNRWISLPPIPGINSPKNLTLGIRGIRFGPDGKLWTIGYNGLIASFEPVGQRWVELFHPAAALQWAARSSPVDLLVDEKKLWVTTGNDGLWCIDIQSKQVQHFRQQTNPAVLPNNLLLGLLPDRTRPDLIWIGSYEGLICLNKKTLKSQLFSTEDGLPDNTIYSILPDKAGYLWLSTNKGLCRFHPVTHQVRVFQTADGLPGDEFNRFHHLELPDGRLAFGGTDGWTLFDPNTVKDDNYQPPVAFTSLRINTVPVHYGSNRPLTAPLNSLNELSLPYDQNSLTFEFAGLEFNQPQKLLYRYQLEGYDDNWIQAGHSPLVNYTKLPP